MVTGRVSQRGQAMFVAVAQQQSDDVGQHGHHGGEHRDAGPQPVSGGDHQPGAEADEHQRRFDKRPDFPRRAEPEPDYRCGGHHTEHTDQSQILKAYPDGVIVGSLVAPEDRKSPANASAILGAAMAQRHGGRYPTPHPYRGGRWLVRHAGNIGVVV